MRFLIRFRGAHITISSIDRLRHDMTSYNTRHSAYGDPRSCMPGTRVKILADLADWALDDGSSKVYWMVEMAGTGKSTISHTLRNSQHEKYAWCQLLLLSSIR